MWHKFCLLLETQSVRWLLVLCVTYQFEFSENRMLSQWVVNNILKHRIVLSSAVALPNIRRLSHSSGKEQTQNMSLQDDLHSWSAILVHVIPVSTTETPMKNNILISAAIFVLLLWLKKTEQVLSESAGSFCGSWFWTEGRDVLFVLRDLWAGLTHTIDLSVILKKPRSLH